jgi:C-terminal processing protease CtpA/Prc
MTLAKKTFGIGAAVLLGCNLLAVADSSSPQFQEIYDLLRTNMAGANQADLNRAAVRGLIGQLSPKVSIIEEDNTASGHEANSPVSLKTSVFENSFGYLRLGQFGPGTDKKLLEAYRGMASTNRIKGLIVDLRYSQGDDYAGAAALADRFFSKDEPLLDWGEGMRKSTAKTNALDLPVALLVNQKTSGAAEAFAAILRQAQIGVLIGTNTAGNAAIAKEFVLSTGQRVRVASTPIILANNKSFPSEGLKPDIFVSVNPDDELAWFDDAYKVLSKPTARVNPANATNDVASLSTNRLHRPRLNEAELVRMLKEGLNPENELGSAAREIERARGIVGDPVLARALDLLKGLTVVQQFRSS